MAQLPSAHWHLVGQLSGEGYFTLQHPCIRYKYVWLTRPSCTHPVGVEKKGCSHLFQPIRCICPES